MNDTNDLQFDSADKVLIFEAIEEQDDERLVLERFSKNEEDRIELFEADVMIDVGELNCSSIGIVGDNDDVSVEDDICL